MGKWVAVPLLSLVIAVGIGERPTAAGDLEVACPCDLAWPSHAAYVGCVATEVGGRRSRGAVRPKEARALLRAARASSCGRAGLTRCCIYATDDDVVGRCRLLTPDACDALDARMDDGEADDAGSGSCLPNPCAG